MISAERDVTAFLDGPDTPDISNPIHSTEVATAYGFDAALVGGVSVYGWCARTIIDALGQGWLDHGWADIQFRRPVYPGNALHINVDEQGVLHMTRDDGTVCVRGAVGLGEAAFLGEFAKPRRTEPVPAADPPEPLEPRNAPIGKDLAPMRLPYFEADAVAYLEEKQRDVAPPWVGDDARIHPGWLAARMTPLLHHSYSYAPAIHARSQIQHLAPARVGQYITVAGRFVETYERKGNHYGIVDGLILGEDGTNLARIRHTTIYSVARPD